jgi:hypothetical protein
MSTIIVAVVSGVVSLAAAAIALVSNRGVARLSSELEERRRLATKHEQAEELRARYRDPLIAAVFDLQSRLYNIVAQDFLSHYVSHQRDGESARRYAIDNTLFLLAEYLAWVEIIRREIQFLDLGEELANRRWLQALEQVRDVLARDDLDPVLRLFRGEQRAIGETMTVVLNDTTSGRMHESLGYSEFVARHQDPALSRWFGKLEVDVQALACEPEAHLKRVVLLQNSLIDVLDVLDPECKRFPAARRSRLR